MAERFYELKDQTTGFYDSQTGFKIVRDQRKPLGKNVGMATTQAIQNGRLVEARVAQEKEQKGDNKSSVGTNK